MKNPFDENLAEAMKLYLDALQRANPTYSAHYKVNGNKLVLDEAAFYAEVGTDKIPPNPVAERVLLDMAEKLGEVLTR